MIGKRLLYVFPISLVLLGADPQSWKEKPIA